MIIGTAYYPEHWNKGRWENDAILMQKMGINAVRIGEFGWSVMEREEGRYDFSLYDEVIDLLSRYDIKVVLGTPTATPPAWLCQKLPDIYMEDKCGIKRGFGTRRHYCYNHRSYRYYSQKIVSAMADHFKENPQVIAWQVDNELGCEDEVRCYCPDCQKEFQNWLEKKYHNLDTLNEAWGTIFWSQTYTDWKQIPLPKQSVIDAYTGYGHNPGLLLDFARFSSDSLINYAKMQSDLIRQYTEKPVIHNMVSEYCDNYNLAQVFDGIGYDAYPRSEWDCNSPGRIGFHYDITRGYAKKPLWILEQQSGPCGWNVLGDTPKEGQLGLWSMQGAARGITALFYFRWRTCLFGTEQFWYGILDHDGVPRRRYYELQKAISQIQEYQDILRLPNQKQVLLIYDYDNKFSHEFQPHSYRFVYKEEVIHIYESLLRLHLSVDVGGFRENFNAYEIVILPFCSMIDDDTLKRLKKYVEDGGTLILTPFSGQRKMNNQITEETLPGVFRQMAQLSVEEFYSLGDSVLETANLGNAVIWCELLKPESAQSLATYEINGHICPAITMSSCKKGHVCYLASIYENYDKVFEKLCESTGISGFNLPKEVECIAKEGKDFLILLNHSDSAKAVSLSGYHRINEDLSNIVMEPFSYTILQKNI